MEGRARSVLNCDSAAMGWDSSVGIAGRLPAGLSGRIPAGGKRFFFSRKRSSLGPIHLPIHCIPGFIQTSRHGLTFWNHVGVGKKKWLLRFIYGIHLIFSHQLSISVSHPELQFWRRDCSVRVKCCIGTSHRVTVRLVGSSVEFVGTASWPAVYFVLIVIRTYVITELWWGTGWNATVLSILTD